LDSLFLEYQVWSYLTLMEKVVFALFDSNLIFNLKVGIREALRDGFWAKELLGRC